MPNLETRRRGVNGGISNKKPKTPLLPPFLCVSKDFVYTRDAVSGLNADG
jgi:hypothetical protein